MKNNFTHLIIYSSKLCGDCQKLKTWLDKNKIDYENRDIRDSEHRENLEKNTNRLAVPYLKIHKEWIQGYESNKPFNSEYIKGILIQNQII